MLRNSKRIYAVSHSTERFFWQAKLFASYWCADDKNAHLTKHATWSLLWKDLLNLMRTGRDEGIPAAYCKQSRNQLLVHAQGRRTPSLWQLKDILWKGGKKASIFESKRKSPEVCKAHQKRKEEETELCRQWLLLNTSVNEKFCHTVKCLLRTEHEVLWYFYIW